MVEWNNLWQFVLAVVRLGSGVIAFALHHFHVRVRPPRDCPLVTVRQGQLRGVAARLPNGAPYYYFKGVPYAEPPVGKLRFKAPVPVERFRKSVVNCYAERYDFIQLDFFSGFVFGSESGLYLNVYTPQLPVDGEETPMKANQLPVMVFLHGGGFACGSGSSLFYNPEYFLQRGVLVVTVNYRLGPFGFLYLPEAGVEGNAGLKDQLMALRWINENIANFGGDPSNVTLFGESAGSFSAYLHMLSPNSRKYFHRVICQSGVVCSSSFMQANPVEMAFNLARHFGYSGTSQQGALETLQQVPAKLLAKQQRKALGQGAEKHPDLVFIFLPVVEQTLTDHSIITQPPEVLLKAYDTLRMPLLEGCNDGEGILGLYIIRRKTRGEDIRHLPDRVLAKLFRHLTPTERAEMTDKVRQFYFSDAPPSAWSTDQIKHLLTDVIFMMDSAINAEWLAKYQPNLRHYHYRFTYDGRYSLLKRLFLSANVAGACHGDDLMYMFNPIFLPPFAPLSDECRVRDNFIALWTSFAKHGDPSVDSRDVVDVEWRPVGKVPRDASKSFQLDCLEINVQPAMMIDPCRDRAHFWRELLETYQKGHL
uniref:Carboxylic ester hydrolase n=1 Tax=Anopheles culicifacies TaxID=139723 RepID=A0A182MVN1_9DIPT